ncbi:hypothetical protein PAAG_02807 [Paracoccidioides lutzii Pb01]|uniref:Uncharacterized protein n=1 Tax=Paracoccidioides lutzii (strain ATCC MYA-826 / Pb01) TaxID=502779 RepID=C1GWB2_PARBA|nr:hypothetical protein PAAG_02807 [Paracoccidioides lutzii Pb01]EEH40831.1 hypothetical protein PAAG_02807 [Paracoccidioides lutzii Pb01]
MQFKLLTILALTSSFVVADEVAGRDLQDELNSIGAGIVSQVKGNIDSFATILASIPSDVMSVLITAVPQPTGTNLSGYFDSLISDVKDGNPPAWYTGLPDNAKMFLSSKASQLATAVPTDTGPTATGNAATTTGAKPTSSAQPNGNAPARPAGAILGGIAGVAGVLGLAVLL